MSRDANFCVKKATKNGVKTRCWYILKVKQDNNKKFQFYHTMLDVFLTASNSALKQLEKLRFDGLLSSRFPENLINHSLLAIFKKKLSTKDGHKSELFKKWLPRRRQWS